MVSVEIVPMFKKESVIIEYDDVKNLKLLEIYSDLICQ